MILICIPQTIIREQSEYTMPIVQQRRYYETFRYVILQVPRPPGLFASNKTPSRSVPYVRLFVAPANVRFMFPHRSRWRCHALEQLFPQISANYVRAGNYFTTTSMCVWMFPMFVVDDDDCVSKPKSCACCKTHTFAMLCRWTVYRIDHSI